MQQGPVPTQLCCGTSKLGGARLTRMKESHEVHEIRQGTSDERPLCWLILSVTSCVESYTVGYLYVTGTDTAQSTGNGIISGFNIDHNTGSLTPITRSARLLRRRQPGSRRPGSSSRFLYVLNRGVSQIPRAVTSAPRQYPCTGSNITQFAVGGNGILTQQETSSPRASIRSGIITDSSESFLMCWIMTPP